MLQFSALLLMSTILTFVMDSDGLFLCSLTHICGVQMVITLCPKPNKMPPVLGLMALEKKKLAKKTGSALILSINSYGFTKSLIFLSVLPSLLHPSFGENLIEHLDVSISGRLALGTPF